VAGYLFIQLEAEHVDHTTNLENRLQTKWSSQLCSILHEWSAVYVWSITQTSWIW